MRVFNRQEIKLTITRLSLCGISKRAIKPTVSLELLPAELRKSREVFDSDAARKIFEEQGEVPGCEIGPEFYVRGL